jgi:glycosyltransferase involved in cell wall biosynthesis
MTLLTDAEVRPPAAARTATVEIVIPVYNEAQSLESSVRTLRRYLDEQFPFPASVTIADNASTDATWDIASRLAAQIPGVLAVHLAEKGRGRALRSVWSASSADVVAYMDVDLATDLDAILPLVAPLVSGHSDVAIGTRLASGARVVRGPKRELISRVYNLMLRTTMRNHFSDAQCGFKAVRGDVAQALLPHIADQGWFFDTELLVLAEHNGLRIHEVPVDWVDDPDSRVDIMATALGDLRGMWRMTRRFARGEGRIDLARHRPGDPLGTAGRFVGVGGASTVAYLVMFLLLQIPLNLVAANVIALTASAVVNYLAHRRYTFPAPNGPGAKRFAWASLGALAAGLLLSTVALGLVAPLSTGVTAALVVLVAANAAVSIGRVVAIRASLLREHLDAVALLSTQSCVVSPEPQKKIKNADLDTK